MSRYARVLGTRRGALLVLLLSLFVFGGIMGALGSTSSNSAPIDLPSGAESATVRQLQTTLPSSATTSALVVYSRGGTGLTAADETAILGRLAPLAALDHVVLPPSGELVHVSNAGVTFIDVPFARTANGDVVTKEVADVRKVAKVDLPAGVVTQVTGEAGFAADLTNVFNGADLKLLLATVLVVAFLLVLTYRSALLWLVPLIVIGFASQVAAAVAGKTLPHLGLTFDAATSGILSVLVFGAGTDYALLLVSRYRDELKRHESRFDAMREALAEAAPAILGSGLTVTLALVTLALAEIPSTRSLGVACAIGVLVALVAALALLPSALVLFGRGIFWPVIPRYGTYVEATTGYFARLGERVRHVPVMATILSLVVLAILATGTFSLTLGLSQTQSFRSTPESVLGQETLAKAFPAGATAPTIVMTTPEAAAQVATVAAGVPGVFSARAGEATSTLARVDVILKDAPDTTGSYQAIEALREALADVPSVEHHALVGGQVAEDYDLRQAWSHDRGLLIPLVALVIFIVLMVVLRSLLAPVLLMVTVIASYFGALGASQFLYHYLYGFPGVDVGVPLIGFIFLAALGVDYNIFLISRTLEERRSRPIDASMVRSLSVTGVVITSAGILLAAVFAVLGVLPLITLTQIGVLVGVGVLLDTLLVRTVLVPALVFLTGDRFFWPRRLDS